MKKLSFVLVVMFFVGMIAYGQSCENVDIDRVIKGDSVAYAPGGKIIVEGGASAIGGSIILKPGNGMNEKGNVIMDMVSGSLVGIGTASPADKLHVNGTVRMNGFNLPTGAASGYVLTSDGSGVGTWQPLSWSENGSDIYYNTGNVGIGTANPDELLHVSGGNVLIGNNYKLIGERTDSSDADLIGMNGNFLEIGEATTTPEGVKVYTPTDEGQGFNVLQANGSTSALWVENDGKVGIGTTSPNNLLHVTGSGDLVRVEGTDDPTILLKDNTDSDYLKFGITNALGGIMTGSGADLAFYTSSNLSWPSPSNERMRIDVTGNVGIGATNPGAKLEIGDNGILRAGNAGMGGSYMAVSLNDETFSASNYNLLSSASDHLYINRPSGANIYFREANSDEMVITSGGNIGIGITSPEANLHIYDADATGTYKDSYTTLLMDGSDSRLQIRSTNGGTYGSGLILSTADKSWALMGQTSTDNNKFYIGYRQSSSSEDILANSSKLLTIQTDGNVGIGTTSPGEELDVNGTIRMNGFNLPTDAVSGYVLTSDGSGVGTWQSIPLQWSESGSDIYYNTGNVGIGTATPGEELDVVGTIKTDSFKLPTDASDGYVLTSDGSGVGTWQSIPSK